MARLRRLVLPGHGHWVIQRGLDTRPIFADARDREAYRGALRTAATEGGVSLLAWALLDDEVQLLAVPADASALGRLMQAVGRRYVSAYHRRHGGAGTLWDGRYRCAVVEPGPTLLALMASIDSQSAEAGHTSAAARLSGVGDSRPTDPPEYWQLGNTPFEREAAYRRCMAEGIPAGRAAAMRKAALGGWAVGSAGFADSLVGTDDRPAAPRQAGRPRRTSAASAASVNTANADSSASASTAAAPGAPAASATSAKSATATVAAASAPIKT